jgi:DNA/RNA-binding domain of Phe-tRNA-synthetase-like protein
MRADCEIVWRSGQELGVRISSFRHSQRTHV